MKKIVLCSLLLFASPTTIAYSEPARAVKEYSQLKEYGFPDRNDERVKFWLAVYTSSSSEAVFFNSSTLEIYTKCRDCNVLNVKKRLKKQGKKNVNYRFGSGELLEDRLKNFSYLDAMEDIFRSRGVPEFLVYMVLAESKFDPYARSHLGAAGLWQFMPETARRFDLKVDAHHDERLDPLKSTIAAADYLSELYDKFGSWPVAVLAYNQGEGGKENNRGVKGYLTRYAIDRDAELKEVYENRGYLTFRELRGYSKKISFSELKDYIPKRYFSAQNFVETVSAAVIICSSPEEYGLDLK